MQLDFEKIIEAMAGEINNLITIKDGENSLKLTSGQIAKSALKGLARELPEIGDFDDDKWLISEVLDVYKQLKEFGNEKEKLTVSSEAA